MFASAHLAAGFVTGMSAAYLTDKRIPRVGTAFALGVLSHVVLDAIPHGDYTPLAPATIQRVVLCEIVVMCTIGWLIVRTRLKPGWPWYLLPGLAGAVILDAKFVARLVLPPNAADAVARFGDHLHSYFHASHMSHPKIGWATEIIATVILLAILTRFPRTSPE